MSKQPPYLEMTERNHETLMQWVIESRIAAGVDPFDPRKTLRSEIAAKVAAKRLVARSSPTVRLTPVHTPSPSPPVSESPARWARARRLRSAS